MTPKFVFGKEKNDWIKRPLLSNIEKILDYRGRTPKKLERYRFSSFISFKCEKRLY